ncbi:MAG: winged helix-turn-helix transcriptional regulator [Chloroflexi bacterium]|nr:winged helix-turn-helix transcriptional regulator [Chloroflexota bacterium]
MPKYQITRWLRKPRKNKKPSPDDYVIREIEANDCNEAFDALGWKIFECSIQLIDGPIKQWNTAKQAIRDAIKRTPNSILLKWGDMGFVGNAHNMSDIQLLESLADEIDSGANYFVADDSNLDIDLHLSDTYLLCTFAMWRIFSKDSEYIRNHCRYCEKNGEIVRWETSRKQAIKEDVPLYIYVCLTGLSCWEKALNDGYKAISNNRRLMVELLLKQEKSAQEIRDILRIGKSTVRKDIRILRQEGKLQNDI